MATFTFEVEWSNDKDALMAGNTVQGISTVTIQAPIDGDTDARLAAEEMVLCRGVEPTRTTLVAFD